MPGAQNVRFLAVSGQIWIGNTPLWYDFTLVEYHVYIDEVSWLIFSVLGGASETEFEPHFWKTLNQNRKDHWDFHKVAWLPSKSFCVLVGCFVLELALLRSDLCSTFEPPKRDIVNAFANSFNQHNKVRRPGESHRGAGRKKNGCPPKAGTMCHDRTRILSCLFLIPLVAR